MHGVHAKMLLHHVLCEACAIQIMSVEAVEVKMIHMAMCRPLRCRALSIVLKMPLRIFLDRGIASSLLNCLCA